MAQIAIFNETSQRPELDVVAGCPVWSLGDERSADPLLTREGAARALAARSPMLDLEAAGQTVRLRGARAIDDILPEEAEQVRSLGFLLSHAAVSVPAAEAALDLVETDGWMGLLQDPYRIAGSRSRVGFSAADAVAGALGIQGADPVRLQGAGRWVFRQARSTGEVVLGRRATVGRIRKLLGDVNAEVGEAALLACVDAGIMEEVDGVMLHPMARRAGRLLRHMARNPVDVRILSGAGAPASREIWPRQAREKGEVWHPGLWDDEVILSVLEDLSQAGSGITFRGDPRWTHRAGSLRIPQALARALRLKVDLPAGPGTDLLRGRGLSFQEGRPDKEFWMVDASCRSLGPDGFPLDGPDAYREEHESVLHRMAAAVQFFTRTQSGARVVCVRETGPLGRSTVLAHLDGSGAEVLLSSEADPTPSPTIILWHISDQRSFSGAVLGTLLDQGGSPSVLISTGESMDFTLSAGVARDRRAVGWVDLFLD